MKRKTVNPWDEPFAADSERARGKRPADLATAVASGERRPYPRAPEKLMRWEDALALAPAAAMPLAGIGDGARGELARLNKQVEQLNKAVKRLEAERQDDGRRRSGS